MPKRAMDSASLEFVPGMVFRHVLESIGEIDALHEYPALGITSGVVLIDPKITTRTPRSGEPSENSSGFHGPTPLRVTTVGDLLGGVVIFGRQGSWRLAVVSLRY